MQRSDQRTEVATEYLLQCIGTKQVVLELKEQRIADLEAQLAAVTAERDALKAAASGKR